jgi:A/G-specific adenine glycosylase
MSGAQIDAPARFASLLVAWQSTHGRHDLPWQNTRDAYRIWLSEIMLQQTQVGTVIPYYLRFLDHYPRVADLAAASLDRVLELWAGLGYYARARNLHRCAQTLVAEHGGQFPEQPVALAALPGIGRSTAAAIAAFAFGARAAILDGNVKRVLARCFGVSGNPATAQAEQAMWRLAESLLPEQGIEAYTQGIMDLGATLCTRARPQCESCPMSPLCVARRDGRQAELPEKRAKQVLPERESSLLLFTDGQRVLLERRPPTGIWGGLLSLPEGGEAAIDSCLRRFGGRLIGTSELPPIKHSFTHFRLTLRPVRCAVEVTAHIVAEPGWQWLKFEDLGSAALPAPVARLLAAMTNK